MNDKAREFIKADADATAELLKKYFGGDWEVTADFDETTGKVTFHEKCDGTVKQIKFTQKIPTDFWKQQ